MRVLVAQIPMPQNRFLLDLNGEISKHCAITHSSDDFWNMKGEYDIIHLHFPEHLTYDIEKFYFDGIKYGASRGLNDEIIADTEKRLAFWSSRAKMIVTRHVLLPHDALSDPMWEKMYEMFYSYSHGVAHFASASIHEFQTRYKEINWVSGSPPIHAVIPHQNYTSLPNEVTRSEARTILGIPQEASVLLIFGAIRNGDSEKSLIVNTFANIRVPKKLLLVSSWREQLRNISWIRLKYWIRDLTRLYFKWHPSYNFNYGFVDEKDAQLYLNAADVLLIPRLWVLNSGNITLGMTFGRVVVGPDAWDVGELLRETGNPVFDPDRPETAVAAVEEGFRLAREGRIGRANQELALREWGSHQCASLYLDLYRKVLGAGLP